MFLGGKRQAEGGFKKKSAESGKRKAEETILAEGKRRKRNENFWAESGKRKAELKKNWRKAEGGRNIFGGRRKAKAE